MELTSKLKEISLLFFCGSANLASSTSIEVLSTLVKQRCLLVLTLRTQHNNDEVEVFFAKNASCSEISLPLPQNRKVQSGKRFSHFCFVKNSHVNNFRPKKVILDESKISMCLMSEQSFKFKVIELSFCVNDNVSELSEIAQIRVWNNFNIETEPKTSVVSCANISSMLVQLYKLKFVNVMRIDFTITSQCTQTLADFDFREIV